MPGETMIYLNVHPDDGQRVHVGGVKCVKVGRRVLERAIAPEELIVKKDADLHSRFWFQTIRLSLCRAEHSMLGRRHTSGI